jgi:flagellar protein FlaI
MPELVPILEFMHLLDSEGVKTDTMHVLTAPAAHWRLLPRQTQSRFLRERQAEGEPEDVADLAVVKRRGRPVALENVYVRMDFTHSGGLRGSARRARERLLYQAFETPGAEAAAQLLATPLPAAGGPEIHLRVIDLLDHVWGGDPYDVARDGALCEFETPFGLRERERYWLEEPFSLASVVEGEDHEMGYQVHEPSLTALERALLVTMNDRMRDVLIMEPEGVNYRAGHLLTRMLDMLRMYRFRTDRRTAYKLGYYFLRNYLGLGRIEPLMRDTHVEDVSCNGPNLPVFVAHARHQSLRTNVTFDEMELNSFTMKLAQRGGKLLSVAQPLVDATLPGGSRVQACLGREITSRGSAFTIRKFREDPLTCVDLIRKGTHSLDTMAFLWLAVEMRRSLLVMGATASGKTTALNCLGQFIPPSLKIVSIEDTREITLQQENWLAAVTREGFSGSGPDKVSMFDLLRAALRQRPDYLVVGEIRGVEGLTLFQAMSTGHTCFSTMHAGSVENAVYRLENPPINVPRVMLTALDFFVTQGQVDLKDGTARRMLSLTEVNGIDPQTRNLRVNELFRWDAASDEHVAVAGSTVLDRARAKGGWTRSRLDEELVSRRRVLEGLVARDERHYGQVAKAVRRFYAEQIDDHGFIPGPVTPPGDIDAGVAPLPPMDFTRPPGLRAAVTAAANAPRSP